MIEIQQIRQLYLTIQDDDIENFVSIINKLLISSKQTGYKKPFTVNERDCIERIAESLNLDKPEECRINSEKEQIIGDKK